MAQNELDIVVKLKDQASAGLRKIKTGVESMNREIDNVKKSSKSFREMADRAQKAGAVMTAMGGAVLFGAGKAIGAASDLGESMNAVSVVFGDASDKVIDFGRQAANAAGLSQKAFNESVVPIGAQLQNLGFSAEQAAEQAIILAQRSADMASVMNKDVDQAIGAIAAGLRGESEQLRNFAVTLSQAEIENYALAQGLVNSKNEIDANIKAQATLGIIMDQTNQFAGDFANTSDSLANQQRILSANLENTSATLGEALKPILESVNNTIVPLVQRIGEWAQENPKLTATIVKIVAAVGLFMVAFGPLLVVLPGIIAAFTAFSSVAAFLGIGLLPLATIIAGVVAGIAALVAITVLVVKNWDKIKAATVSAWNFVKETVVNAITTASNFISTKWNNTIGKIVDTFNRVKAVVSAFFKFFAAGFADGDFANDWLTHMPDWLANISKAIGAVMISFSNFFNGVKEAFIAGFEFVKSIFNGIVTFIQGAWQFIQDAMKFGAALSVGLVIAFFNMLGIDIVAVMKKVVEGVKAAFNAIVEFVSTKFNQVAKFVNSAMEAIAGYISEKLEKIRELWSMFSEWIRQLWLSVTTFFIDTFQAFSDWFMQKLDILKLGWDIMFTNFRKIVQNAWNWIKTTFMDGLNAVIGFITGFTKPMGEAAGSLWGAFRAATADVLNKVKGIVKDAFNWIIGKINKLLSGINKIANLGASVLGIDIPNIPEIPMLANGGTITQPGAAIVGEEGPEFLNLPRGAKVTPLDKAGGGGVVVNIYNPNVLNDDDIVEKIGDPIMQVIKQHMAIV